MTLLSEGQGRLPGINIHYRLGQSLHWDSVHSKTNCQACPALSAALISVCEKQTGCPALWQPDKWLRSRPEASWQRPRTLGFSEGWKRKESPVKWPEFQGKELRERERAGKEEEEIVGEGPRLRVPMPISPQRAVGTKSTHSAHCPWGQVLSVGLQG